MRITLALTAAAALHGCGGGISGEVRDATTERPVPRARVAVTNVGVGVSGGSLMKDKTTVTAAVSDQQGRFAISGLSGGVRLQVSADGFNPVDTALCSRSPMVVRVGGPFDSADLGQTLRLTARQGWSFGAAALVPRAAADLAIDTLPTSGVAPVTLRAPAGLAFRPGTGNPATPPALGPVTSIELDLLTQCGWLFVRGRDGGTAAVRIGSYGVDQPPGGEQALMLSFGLLPPR